MYPNTIAFKHHKYLGMLRHFSMKSPLGKAWITQKFKLDKKRPDTWFWWVLHLIWLFLIAHMIIISDTWRSTWVVCIVIKQQYAWGQHDWKYATLAHRRLFRISYFPVNWKSSPSSTYGKGQPFFCNARGCRGSLFQCLSQSKQAKWKASEEEMAPHVYSKSKIRKTLSA